MPSAVPPADLPGPPGIVVTGIGVTSAFGRGTGPLREAVLSGTPGFGPVTRFATDQCRVRVAAALPGSPVLVDELTAVIRDACADADLEPGAQSGIPLLIALHSDMAAARDPRLGNVTGQTAALVAGRCGLPGPRRVYVTACVSATTAVADAAAMITAGRAERILVAAGYLVDADSMGMFDAGRSLAADGLVRPFSAGRRGMLLGDGVAALVLESVRAASDRGAAPMARLAGWGRAGDAHHVCEPRPDGAGLARAIDAALNRAGVGAADVDYVNANGTGTQQSDPAEAAALHRALGGHAAAIPVSSTKSVHGHALEASGLLELVVTILALRSGRLPVNAGYLGADAECDLDLILGSARESQPRYALTLNAAFGGANTALLVEAA
ncbi:MAG TPA: beta-ketoacyl synthase N-terminal-like domain-containing protein [Streptosporangiaceae bacterium]|jgi:3-oxoacyl-(acyl-carrier-protein) synthase|nr:beta-ketoacyl synthase N-terminal-like domain-containing protein [Streptosporangiaceae bacterium]